LRNDKKAEEIAAQRVHMLAPLLAEGLDAGQTKVIKTRICEQTGISERTLRRYLDLYRKEGFNGLKPKGRGKRCSEEAVPIPATKMINRATRVPMRCTIKVDSHRPKILPRVALKVPCKAIAAPERAAIPIYNQFNRGSPLNILT
jgi:hypothetical protein